MRGVQAHTSNPRSLFPGLLLKSTVLFFIMITSRADSDSGWSPCTRQSAHSRFTTMKLVCGQGRLCLDKYALMPQRRCSYFHHFVWECKFMCVIPVYYINALGQNENEYSHVSTWAHMVDPFKVNKLRYLCTYTVRCRWCNLWAEIGLIRTAYLLTCILAADTQLLNVMNLNVLH